MSCLFTITIATELTKLDAHFIASAVDSRDELADIWRDAASAASLESHPVAAEGAEAAEGDSGDFVYDIYEVESEAATAGEEGREEREACMPHDMPSSCDME